MRGGGAVGVKLLSFIYFSWGGSLRTIIRKELAMDGFGKRGEGCLVLLCPLFTAKWTGKKQQERQGWEGGSN